MFLFSEIYEKAHGLFRDPKLDKAYRISKVQYYKAMYSYLQNAISLFDNPAVISNRLTNYTEPVGTLEVFTSDGTTNTYTLDSGFVLIPNSVYCFIENGEIVRGTLNTTNRTVTFPSVLSAGLEYSFEQYFPGSFNDEFNGTNSTSSAGDAYVHNSVKDILARLIVKVWAEGERNDLLDIRNVMQDSEFKRSDNSRILTSKDAWVDQLDTEISQLQNTLAWHIRFMSSSTRMGRR